MNQLKFKKILGVMFSIGVLASIVPISLTSCKTVNHNNDILVQSDNDDSETGELVEEPVESPSLSGETPAEEPETPSGQTEDDSEPIETGSGEEQPADSHSDEPTEEPMEPSTEEPYIFKNI
ncbi:MAG: hypothetical protein LBH55_01535 [Mycoplasmataceae bacterium]|jgi:hypothetical protein|nr:hypothetical protein [Mycoplasmataceae bacterium]